MELAELFRIASNHALATGAGLPDATPSVLAEVCVAVLPVDAAGITMIQNPPIPLGWSDPWAAVMEQVQATLGDGPCVYAATVDATSIFDERSLITRWPIYYAELRSQTPFRSTASLPLTLPGRPRFGTLDLFSDDPSGHQLAFARTVGRSIADQVVERVYDSIYGGVAEHSFPEWLVHDAALQRTDVWLAVRLISEEEGLDEAAALSALRSYAYLHGRSLDDVADDVAGRRLLPGEVLS